jgi:serine/threonine-protein kinase
MSRDYKKYEPIFGSWYISREIGKGSFGTVYEITREEYGTTYKAALKVITVPQDEDDVKLRMTESTDADSITEYYEGVLKEIINENEIMSKLKGNSHIVSYEDHQIIPHEESIGYDILIRMEMLEPLLDRMLKKKLDEEEVVKLGIDMCKALELCHKKNIIHRDIKPQNIFVSENGDYKLGDFGIARTIEKTTGGMSKKGTYKYMAPEVFRGEEYDSSVDLYSLGIVLYSLLNGNRGPFLPAPPEKVTHNDEEEARLRRFRGEPLPPPKDAGAILTQIIRKAAAANPKDRYRNAEEMRRDLESYLEVFKKGAAAVAAQNTAAAKEMAAASITAQSMNLNNYQQAPDNSWAAGYGQMAAAGYPIEVAQKKKKRRLIIPILGVLLLCILGGAFFAIRHMIANKPYNLDLTDIATRPGVTGFNGKAQLDGEITVDPEKKEALLSAIEDEDKKVSVQTFLDGVTYEADSIENLKNGDVIKVSAKYSENVAEALKVNVEKSDFEITVENLKDFPEYLEGAVEYNGHYYKLVDGKGIYWTKAKKACEEQNGHLVTIADAEEEAFIEDLIEKEGKLYHYWLGATDEKKEGDWRWLDGERVNLPGEGGFHKWCGNQPNNNEATEAVGQDYMEIQKTRGDQGPQEYMTWTDIGDSGEASPTFYEHPDYNSTKYYGYICEWDSIE